MIFRWGGGARETGERCIFMKPPDGLASEEKCTTYIVSLKVRNALQYIPSPNTTFCLDCYSNLTTFNCNYDNESIPLENLSHGFGAYVRVRYREINATKLHSRTVPFVLFHFFFSCIFLSMSLDYP